VKRHVAVLVVVVAFLVGVLCGLAVLAVRAAVRNVKSAWQSEMCRGNLTATQDALQRYADSHEGILPTSLDVLVAEHLVDEQQLHCPASGKRYIYLFKDKQVHEDVAFQLVLTEHGFPHPYYGGLKHFTYWGMGFGRISLQEFSDQFEEDPSRLAEVIESWLVRQRERRRGEN